MISIRCNVIELVYSQLMSNIAIDLDQSRPLGHPACQQCGSPTRLTGIEPHPTQAHTDLWTYQCLACDAVQAAVMPVDATSALKRR
jgi:hypothetical protein